MTHTGEFREDLYQRLAVFPILLPPLPERVQDIAPLAEALLGRISAELGRPRLRLDDEAVRRISAAPWRGNVRELANTLERAAILADGDVIRGQDLILQSGMPGSRADPSTIAASRA